MNVEIVTVGDELLLGFTIDTNSAFIARHLASLGIAVVRRTSVGDTHDAIVAAVRDALDRTGAAIVTGGLGPTADDVTKPAIASVFGREIVRDENVVTQLHDIWRARGRTTPLPASNLAQALVPVGAELLPNSQGTAPGLLLEDDDGRWAAVLPGVPREMRVMFTDAVLPRIASRIASRIGGQSPAVIRSATVRTTGVPESALADQLGELAGGVNSLSLAFLPGTDGVDLRLTSRGLTEDATDRALDEGVRRLRDRLGRSVYGEDETDLAAVVLDLCRADALRIAVAESCTGGMLGARLTHVPGASDVFHGGLIAYDNRVKRQILGVLDSDLIEHGAVSEPVALQMARGIRVRLGTEIGISITGVAGPGGGTPDKPVGTVWIAIDVAEGRPPIPRPDGRPPITPHRRARLFQLIGDRDEIRRRATQAALDMLRRTAAELSNLSAL